MIAKETCVHSYGFNDMGEIITEINSLYFSHTTFSLLKVVVQFLPKHLDHS